MRMLAGVAAMVTLMPGLLVAQVAGSTISALEPVPVLSELGGHIVLQEDATVIEMSFRFAIAEDLADVGVRAGALSLDETPTTLALGVDARVAIASADHPQALLPLDVALTAGVGVAFPGWNSQFVTTPVGISMGGQLPFDVGLERPSRIILWVHPRMEHARRVAGDCTTEEAFCRSGWVFRSDIGIKGDLSEHAGWVVVAGVGDTRFSGNAVSLGLRTAW